MKKIKRKILITTCMIAIMVTLIATPVYSQQSIVDIAVSDPDNFSTLVAALTAADLVSALSGPGPFTVFAPTNDAFAALPDGTVEYLLDNIPLLTQVLTYHVVLDEAFSTDLSDGQSIATLQGSSITVNIDGSVMINDATVATADVDASNGVIHVIDKVLVPEGLLDPEEATIRILSSVGGDVDPEPGTYSYPEGTDITLRATPDEGFEFLYWVVSGEFTPGTISGRPNEIIIDGQPTLIPGIPETDFLYWTDNPAQISCGFGYTYQYQAIFAPIAAGMDPPESPVFFDPFDAFQDPATREGTTIVGISSTLGGTTDPNPGRYLFGDVIEPTVTLTATPNEGFEFQYWIVTGDYMPGHGGDPALDTNVIQDNPLKVDHGRGYTYNYEAVFTPIDMDANGGDSQDGDSTHPFGLAPEILTALIVILVIAVIAAVLFGLYMYNKAK